MTYAPYKVPVGQTQGAKGAVTTDTAVLAWIWYDTKNGNGSNTAAPTLKIAATANELVFVSTGDTSLPDDGTTTAGSIDFSVATVDTWGELADVINATNNWKCTLAGAYRALSTASSVVALTAARIAGTAAAISGCTEFAPVRVLADQSGMSKSLVCIGPEHQPGDDGLDNVAHAGSWISKRTVRTGGDPTAIWKAQQPVDLVSAARQIIAEGGNAGGTATPNLNVYDASQSADTIIYKRILADDTELALDATDLQSVRSSPGNRLVVELAQASADSLYLAVNGEYGPVDAF